MEWSRDLLGAGKTSFDAMPSDFTVETSCVFAPEIRIEIEKEAGKRLE